MGVTVYYSEISAHKEVKKRQQKVMMILESKCIPYDSVDITEAGKESDKDFMLKNAKPRGDSKYVLSPQIFNGETYCGDYEDFELANEMDELEKFLGVAKKEANGPRAVQNDNRNQNQNGVNGTSSSREGSAEKQPTPAKAVETVTVEDSAAPPSREPEEEQPNPEPESHPEFEEEEPMSTTEPAPQPPAGAGEEDGEQGQVEKPEVHLDEEEEEEED